jgi:pyruvate,water dikinase
VVSETSIGPKEQQIIADGDQGTKLTDVPEADRGKSSLTDGAIKALTELAVKVEQHFDGHPQDIEWAIVDGKISLLQSRPITNLPPQPIEVVWEPPEDIKALVRRQLIENFADPVTPLCDDLYIHEGLISRKGGRSGFTTLNGFAFQIAGFSEQQTEEEFRQAIYDQRKAIAATPEGMAQEQHDLDEFVAELAGGEQAEFKSWAETYEGKLAHDVTMPESHNPTYVANNKIAGNEKQIADWRDRALPELLGCAEKWRGVDAAQAPDQQLLDGMTELARAEGWYWSSNAGHTFGVGKSTDDHLQCFLRETLPDHHFTSGQFLSGFASKIMQANEDLFGICKLVRANDSLLEAVITTPASRLQGVLESHPDAGPIRTALDEYLVLYGHQGFNLDFGETTQIEDPTPLLVTLKNMVARPGYDSAKHQEDAREKRDKAMAEITDLLDGLAYWQFRYRLWFTNRYYPIREETCFVLGTCWPVLRGLGNELGQRLADDGTLSQADDIYYLMSAEIKQAIEARQAGRNDSDFRALAAERRELREARKRLHPPGTIPPEASQNPGVAFKETQVVNDPNSAVLNGIPVSPGTIEEAASLILNVDEFDKMEPGSILVCPMTTPAWTQLFAHASGLVTDIGGILGHGSIVAREYGIPAVVGTGTGTQRIAHGQRIEINGDGGTIELKEEIKDQA